MTSFNITNINISERMPSSQCMCHDLQMTTQPRSTYANWLTVVCLLLRLWSTCAITTQSTQSDNLRQQPLVRVRTVVSLPSSLYIYQQTVICTGSIHFTKLVRFHVLIFRATMIFWRVLFWRWNTAGELAGWRVPSLSQMSKQNLRSYVSYSYVCNTTMSVYL